jgi:hypothetical protein
MRPVLEYHSGSSILRLFSSSPIYLHIIMLRTVPFKTLASLEHHHSQLFITARFYSFRATAWSATHDLGGVTPCVAAGGGGGEEGCSNQPNTKKSGSKGMVSDEERQGVSRDK